MIHLRTDYAQAVDNRNKTGIQLIDRNDELCILYEKSNIQSSILAHGEHEMRTRDEEIRTINLEEQNLRRKIDVARRQIPSLTTYAATAKMLQLTESELEQERTLINVLVSKLETPGSEDVRARHLGGLDPEPEQVAAKIEVLEERLNDKKEQLLEKELVLDEVSSLSDKLRMQAAESRGPTLDLAKKVNDYQAKIRTTTRKMMASVSELSMYQATAMKLEHQKKEQLADLEEARYRLGQGSPPTEDAEHEWYRMERDRVRRQEAMMERRNATDAQDATASMPGMVRTTAEPRPNAYIPEEVGIPKPYGTLAPFKPSQTGATMRHMRKPVYKEIQL
jgi:chromosome segregation ATPase